MIAADLRFEGFDVRSWTHLLSLFMPGLRDRLDRETLLVETPGTTGPVRGPAAGTLVLVTDPEDSIVVALHSLRGRVAPLVGTRVTCTLAELAAQNGADRVIALHEGAMEDLSERLALRYQPNEDYLSQLLTLTRVARELIDAGLIRLWPHPLANVPIPSARTVQRALNMVLPVDRAAVMVLWDTTGRDPTEMWTAVAIRRRENGIDLVAGPDLLTRWAGPLGGDWRRDYRVFVDAVSRSVAPVHVGIFSEASLVGELLRGADAGHWARAIAVRNVIVNPMPRFVMAGVGADAARGVGKASARALGGLDIIGTLLPLAQAVRAQITQASSVGEILGFDPLTVLGALLRRDEEPEEPKG